MKNEIRNFIRHGFQPIKPHSLFYTFKKKATPNAGTIKNVCLPLAQLVHNLLPKLS